MCSQLARPKVHTVRIAHTWKNEQCAHERTRHDFYGLILGDEGDENTKKATALPIWVSHMACGEHKI